MNALQWGGRFAAPPDERLLAFGSSFERDLVLAPFDVTCSLAHVASLESGGIVSTGEATVLKDALHAVAREIADGTFAARARQWGAEDVHGAVDSRVRELVGAVGERLHCGRSRNDQVATTVLLYVRDRARTAARLTLDIAESTRLRAQTELDHETLIAACTHRQPAQPVLLAFMLAAWTEPLLRAAHRFAAVERDATLSCPLGSAAVAGSTLALDRALSAKILDFAAPSRNALDSIGNRDCALDLAHANVRALVDVSRIAEELLTWCVPAVGYARLGDSVATGSSLMPQKRNPDPFELVRACAASSAGQYAGALATLCGLAPSYQRDLQQTKAVVLTIVEDALVALEAFGRAWDAVDFERDTMRARASDGYTVATDVAEALVACGATARAAHALVGSVVKEAEALGRPLDSSDLVRLASQIGVDDVRAPLDALGSVRAKRTVGSTSPNSVCDQIESLARESRALRETLAR